MIEWLPRKIMLGGNNIFQSYSTLYEVFKRDFIDNSLMFRGQRVVFQQAIDSKMPGEYPHGFTHLITRKNGKVRIFDLERVIRITWVRPIIMHAEEDSRVRILDLQQASEKYGIANNTFLWLAEEDFIVILREIDKGAYRGEMLVTAYKITEWYERKELERKWSDLNQNNN